MRQAINIANILGLSQEQKFIIRQASLFHDIGKLGVDTGIIKKPAPLTEREWAEMKKHPNIGAKIAKRFKFLKEPIPSIIKYHHVRYAGGGYPLTRRIKGRIPIEARVLAVADAYEAMRSNRPYRKGLSKNEAVLELKRYSGTQFDPKIVNSFLKHLNGSKV